MTDFRPKPRFDDWDIAAILREGVDEETRDLAADHIPLTALPFQQGNVGIAAHRDTLFPEI